jgi:DNA-binding beta-propeller fold protein YncE
MGRIRIVIAAGCLAAAVALVPSTPRTNAWDFDTTFSGAFQAVAVNQVDDTVYLIENALGTMSVMNGRDINDMTSITVAAEYDPLYVAVNQADDTVYVANDSGTVSVINGRTNTWD